MKLTINTAEIEVTIRRVLREELDCAFPQMVQNKSPSDNAPPHLCWMNKRCGLVNRSNPCRCAKKTRAHINAGIVDPNNLTFNTRHKKKIYELSEQNAVSITDTVEDLHKSIFQ